MRLNSHTSKPCNQTIQTCSWLCKVLRVQGNTTTESNQHHLQNPPTTKSLWTTWSLTCGQVDADEGPVSRLRVGLAVFLAAVHRR